MPPVLTIDVEFPDHRVDDPHGALDAIVALCHEREVPATFFVQGRWALAFPDRIAELLAAGHSVGLHGFSHIDYRRLTTSGIRAELEDGMNALTAAAPDLVIRYLRLPYGYGGDEPQITNVIEEFGLTVVGWDISTFDWDSSLSFSLSLDRARLVIPNGGIVLFHSWPPRTAELIEGLLDATTDGLSALDDVVLLGHQPNGRTMHVARMDPPRHVHRSDRG